MQQGKQGVNSTPHHARLSRDTHAFFLMCTWLKMFEDCRSDASVRFFKANPSRPCFVAPCLTYFCPHFSPHIFRHLRLVRLLLSHWCTRRSVRPLLLCKEGHDLADWLKNHLFLFASPSVSSKSLANTLRLTYLRERAVSARTLTISRPLWMRLKSAT